MVVWWMNQRHRVAGWVVIALVLWTNVLQTPYAPKLPLVDFGYELTHRYVGPMEGVVGYLQAHGRPGQRVKIPYDDRTVMFYTDLVVEPPSTFTHKTFPDWIVLRRGWYSPYLLRTAYFKQVEAMYDRIELDAPDAFWQNREDPGLHHFQRPWWPLPVVIYRRRVT